MARYLPRGTNTSEIMWHRWFSASRRHVTTLQQRQRAHSYARQLRSFVAAPPWCFDFVHVADDYLEIRGWALLPVDGVDSITFTVNDQEFDSILFPLPWPKIGRIFWYWPHAATSGFICRINRSRAELFANGVATFKYVDRTTFAPLNPVHSCYYADPQQQANVPMPDPTRRRRVHGDTLASAFLLEGASTYTKLAHILANVCGRSYQDFGRILDWGCGCGRLARYFAERTPATFTGTDIDADAVWWCQQHLLTGNFVPIQSAPPTALEAAQFDLIIGISIFTHLRERDQFQWLAELERLAAPGAVLLVTIHGINTVGRADLPEEAFHELQQHGFLDIGRNADLDGFVADAHYHNVFHADSYIRTRWSQFFDILQIIPGVVGNHQDVVVMQKRQQT